MGYGIVDEEEPIKKQYLFSLDEVQVLLARVWLEKRFQKQLNVPVHASLVRPESPVPPAGTLKKVMSTDSLDSSTSSLMDCDLDYPVVHLILTYHE